MDIFRWMRQQWDRTAAAILALVGLLALLLGWLGLSDVALPSQQIPYLASGGLLGLFALGASATLWLSADLRDEWRELHNIESRLDELCEIVRDAERGAPPLSNGADAQPRRRIKAGSGSSERKTLGAKR
jgi:hypothetical protein